MTRPLAERVRDEKPRNFTDAIGRLLKAIESHRENIWPRKKYPTFDCIGRIDDRRLYEAAEGMEVLDCTTPEAVAQSEAFKAELDQWTSIKKADLAALESSREAMREALETIATGQVQFDYNDKGQIIDPNVSWRLMEIAHAAISPDGQRGASS